MKIKNFHLRYFSVFSILIIYILRLLSFTMYLKNLFLVDLKCKKHICTSFKSNVRKYNLR